MAATAARWLDEQIAALASGMVTSLEAEPVQSRLKDIAFDALLSAIERAHAQGTGHGAITPNTIVLEAGQPVLAPGGQPSADAQASDLYAVGTVLYESVSGRSWRAQSAL